MDYLYSKPVLLSYLRFHPRWYKILYYSPSSFKAFLDEANLNLGLRPQDKLNNVKNRFDMFYSVANLLLK